MTKTKKIIVQVLIIGISIAIGYYLAAPILKNKEVEVKKEVEVPIITEEKLCKQSGGEFYLNKGGHCKERDFKNMSFEEIVNSKCDYVETLDITCSKTKTDKKTFFDYHLELN